MSLDQVANATSTARADAARGATSASSRTDNTVPGGGFAALMQSLGDAAGVDAGNSPSGNGDTPSHDRTALAADGSTQDPAAVAAAAAAGVAPVPPARDAVPTANRSANGAGSGTQDGRISAGAAASTASRSGATPTSGSSAAGSASPAGGSLAGAGSLTGSTTTPYLREAALLQQLAGAAATGDGQAPGLAGQTAPGGEAGASTVTALTGDAGAASGMTGPSLGTLTADGASLTLHLQAMLSDALQASAATTGGPAAGPDGLTTLALAGFGDAAGRPLTRTTGNGGQDSSTAGVALLGATTSANDVQMDVPAAAPDAGATTEMRVAQQVTYWVGQGVQSASMEVQGIDEKPIHVSIALQGQEASVNFQAEQLQTQQILQASAPHLRELLQSQGLVLSSLTVGGSGTGSAGSGNSGSASRDAPGGRQAQVLVPDVTAPAGSAGGSGRQGAALDLFV